MYLWYICFCLFDPVPIWHAFFCSVNIPPVQKELDMPHCPPPFVIYIYIFDALDPSKPRKLVLTSAALYGKVLLDLQAFGAIQ